MTKTVLITGASRGLGRAIALRFGREDWRVAVNYLASREKAEAVVNEIAVNGGDAFAFKADVRDFRQVEGMVAETLSRYGRIDCLINNAGITSDGLILKTKDEEWRDVIDTNLKGSLNTIKAVSKILTRQRSGHIINIASISGVRGRAGQAAYSASKAGLIGLTKATAVELARWGIQVNAVLPGYMLTEMGDAAPEKAREEALDDSLLKRYSDPDEVAGFVYHLAGMKAVSGQVFNLDSRII